MTNQGKIRVLIVDDEERFRDNTRKMLDKRGFDTTAVGDGLEAVEKVREQAFDVIILDIMMPRMDGQKALVEIKKLRPEARVIMLTGHGTSQNAVESLKSGVFDFLSKPCEIELLSRKILEAGSAGRPVAKSEPSVKDIMVPFSSFSKVHESSTVDEAVRVLYSSFEQPVTSTTVAETLHRSILVLDDRENIVGLLSITDILRGLQPAYARLLKESLTVQSALRIEAPGFFGLFTIMARDLDRIEVSKLMSEAPPVVDSGECLMAAANKMLSLNVRRMLVTQNSKPVGVIRELDLYFEIVRIIKDFKKA